MCAMKISSRYLVLLCLIYITIPVFEAQEVKVSPEVTGYLGHDVTLPCQFIPGRGRDNITQLQWSLKQPEGERISILVSQVQFGVVVLESFLKQRVEIAEHALIIRAVEMRDAGSYTCRISTFPSGSFEGTTILVVQEEEVMLILPRLIAAGVFVLIVATMLATTYFITIRIRRGALVKHRVCTDGPVMCD